MSASVVQSLRFAHIGLAVTSIETSTNFFRKLGFYESSITTAKSSPSGLKVLQNACGFELHLINSDHGLPEPEKNILMDFSTQKYPGHTHVCFGVPSVPAIKEYLERNEIALSGVRTYKGGANEVAVFVRDPDRNTIELEKFFTQGGLPFLPTAGDAEGQTCSTETPPPLTADMIGRPQGVDHVGTRVTNPEEKAKWYGDILGFSTETAKYPLKPNPLENFGAWVYHNKYGANINFIPNANVAVTKNVLTAEGKLTPGIVYICFTVDDAAAAGLALEAAGIRAFPDEALGSEEALYCSFELPARAAVPYPTGTSVFLQDGDFNIIRLISTSVANPDLAAPVLR